MVAGGARHAGRRPEPKRVNGEPRRNALIGPGLMDPDFAVRKNFSIRSISESSRLQFRATNVQHPQSREFRPADRQ